MSFGKFWEVLGNLWDIYGIFLNFQILKICAMCEEFYNDFLRFQKNELKIFWIENLIFSKFLISKKYVKNHNMI